MIYLRMQEWFSVKKNSASVIFCVMKEENNLINSMTQRKYLVKLIICLC